MLKSVGTVMVTVIVTAEVRLPEVPLMVKVEALAAAAVVAVSVSVLADVVLTGLNDAVTPVGKPVALRATVALKPPCGATAMVVLPVPPWSTFTLETEEESLKDAAAVTVKAMMAWADEVPTVPVTVSVDAPSAAEAVTVTLRVVPVNAAVTPAGAPAMVRTGVPVKPFNGFSVIVLDPAPPAPTLRLAGAADNVKLGPAFTVRLSVTEA